MPLKTRTGKKFILVAKSVVGKTTGTFPDKKVTISGKGELSGKLFSTDITIKAGQPKRILNGYLLPKSYNDLIITQKYLSPKRMIMKEKLM